MSLLHRIKPVQPSKPDRAKPAPSAEVKSEAPTPPCNEPQTGRRGRPKSEDPKVAVTLRLPKSALDRWQRDPDWRAKMTDLLTEQAG